MRNFTISNYEYTGSGSYRHLMKGLLLSMAIVFFSFTDGFAQDIPTLEQKHSQENLSESQNSADFDLESNISSKYNWSMAKDMIDALPNPPLADNTTCANLRVAFVLDESRSIITRNGVEQVKDAAYALAEAFQGSPAFISIIEFDQQARIVDLGTNNVSTTFLNNFDQYLNGAGYNGQTYAPAPVAGSGCLEGYTNWEDALLAIDSDINLVIFMTDGDPTAYNAPNSCGYVLGTGVNFLIPAVAAANTLKANGTHMFGIGVGDHIFEGNLQMITGPSNFANGGDIFNTDYLIGSFDALKDNLTAGLNAICGTVIDIDKSADVDQVCGDETITFTITVTNTGGSYDYAAADVVVTDTFPSYFTDLAIVGEVEGATLDGQNLTILIDALAANESVSIQLTANLGSAPYGVYTNIAHANAVNANKVQDDASVEKTNVITSEEVVSACQSFSWNGTDYTESGNYFHEGFNENGCPVSESLDLTINQPLSSEINEQGCGSWTWERTGEVFTETVTGAVRVFPGEAGQCDETVILNITITPADEIVELCTEEWPFDSPWGESYYESGIYYIQFSETNCAILHLTFADQIGGPCYLLGEEGGEASGIINADCECVPNEGCDPDATEFSAEACQEYAWEGELYTTSGDHERTFTNIAGCDSVVTLHLTINQPTSGEESAVACETFDWNGMTYNASGDYEYIFTGAGGQCDSTATLHLTINQPTFGEESVTTCETTYEWNGSERAVPGSYSHIFEGLNGQCDSTATLNLIVGDCCEADAGAITFGDGEIINTICGDDDSPSLLTFAIQTHWKTGAGYWARGIVTDASGNIIYMTDSQAAAEAYDFDNLGLGTFYLYVVNFDPTQSNYNELNDILTNNGVVNIEDFTGCFDLSSPLTIISEDSPSGEETIVACESFEWNGMDYTVDGDYTHVFPGENGKCDSTATLHLTILQPTESTETKTACGSYTWYGTQYTESGLYSHVDESGVCPHTYYLDLVIEICGDEVCNNFKYFYVAGNTPGVANGTVFDVDLSGPNAILTELFQTGFDDAHMAVNEEDELIYVISGNGNEIRTYTMDGASYTSVIIAPGLQRTVAMAYDPNNPGTVLVGDQNLKKVSRLDPVTGSHTVVVANAPVFGGDIFFIGNQSYLVQRVSHTHSNVFNITSGTAVLESTVAPSVNGASATASNGFVVASGAGGSSFYTYDADGSNEVEHPAIFAGGGEVFIIRDGDMAGGCFDDNTVIDDCEFVMYLASDQNAGAGGLTDIYAMTVNPDKTTNNTLLTTLEFPCHGLAYSPEGNEGRLYMINTAQTHSSYVVWDIESNTAIGSPITMKTSGGQPIPNVPTGVYRDGVLYAASYFHNKVYFINPSTGVAFASIPTDVNGGDLVFDKNGDLWYAHRYTQEFTNLTGGGSFVIPSLANIHGVALMPNGNFMVANGAGESVFYEVDPVAGGLVSGGLYETGIDQLWGDLAGVDCFDNDEAAPKLAKSNSPASGTDIGNTVSVQASAIMSSYPNPTSGASKVAFTVPNTEMTTLEVYDMNGRNVATIFNQIAEKDQPYSVDFNGTDLPNGVYIYRLTTTNSTIIDKFMIAR